MSEEVEGMGAVSMGTADGRVGAVVEGGGGFLGTTGGGSALLRLGGFLTVVRTEEKEG